MAPAVLANLVCGIGIETVSSMQLLHELTAQLTVAVV
jgi:hypothetical protein